VPFRCAEGRALTDVALAEQRISLFPASIQQEAGPFHGSQQPGEPRLRLLADRLPFAGNCRSPRRSKCRMCSRRRAFSMNSASWCRCGAIGLKKMCAADATVMPQARLPGLSCENSGIPVVFAVAWFRHGADATHTARNSRVENPDLCPQRHPEVDRNLIAGGKRVNE